MQSTLTIAVSPNYHKLGDTINLRSIHGSKVDYRNSQILMRRRVIDLSSKYWRCEWVQVSAIPKTRSDWSDADAAGTMSAGYAEAWIVGEDSLAVCIAVRP